MVLLHALKQVLAALAVGIVHHDIYGDLEGGRCKIFDFVLRKQLGDVPYVRPNAPQRAIWPIFTKIIQMMSQLFTQGGQIPSIRFGQMRRLHIGKCVFIPKIVSGFFLYPRLFG